jgi:hypothetical protein
VERWVDQAAIPYDCPGARQLDLSFQSLPATTSIPSWFMTNIPFIAVLLGSVSFIFVCLWIAIFKCALCPPPCCASMGCSPWESRGVRHLAVRTFRQH